MQLEATSYFSDLYSLLVKTRVTDKSGKEITINDGVKSAVGFILSTQDLGGKVIVIGNGGSAAIASHVHVDLNNAMGMKAVVLHEPSLLTALSNDYGYQVALERQVSIWGSSGDTVFAISSSGRSENILRAVKESVKKDCKVITFSGFETDNALSQVGDLNFYTAANKYGAVESAHAVLTHYITDCAVASKGMKG